MKRENGYTGVDIAISIVVITIFLSIITVLTYRFNSSSDDMKLKSEALTIATNKIEEIKSKNIDDNNISETLAEVTGKQGFYRKVEVTDAADIIDFEEGETPVEGLVKKVTVTVLYNFRNKEEKIELSTLLTREF